MLNCQRCGNEFLSGFKNGKKTINCESCRAIHNTKNIKKPEHILKCEKMPVDSFYKQDKINIVNNDLEEQTNDTNDTTPSETPPNDPPPCDVLYVEHVEPKPDKTIRELLNDVFNTLEHLEKANIEHMKQTDNITNIVFDILNKLITSENNFNNFIKTQNLKDTLNNADNEINEFNDFIKKQNLKNNDINIKLDKIISCVI